jgi:hypothetical protein
MFIFIDIMIAFHAYKFTHFFMITLARPPGAERTWDPGQTRDILWCQLCKIKGYDFGRQHISQCCFENRRWLKIHAWLAHTDAAERNDHSVPRPWQQQF